MSLEEYKRQVVECLIKNHNYTTQDIDGLMTIPEDAWMQYMEDFSPKVAAQGIVSGLI